MAVERAPFAVALAEALKKWMRAEKISGRQLAKQIGIPLTTWNHIGAGSNVARDPEIYARIFFRTGLKEADPHTVPPIRRTLNGIVSLQHRHMKQGEYDAWVEEFRKQNPNIPEATRRTGGASATDNDPSERLQTKAATQRRVGDRFTRTQEVQPVADSSDTDLPKTHVKSVVDDDPLPMPVAPISSRSIGSILDAVLEGIWSPVVGQLTSVLQPLLQMQAQQQQQIFALIQRIYEGQQQQANMISGMGDAIAASVARESDQSLGIVLDEVTRLRKAAQAIQGQESAMTERKGEETHGAMNGNGSLGKQVLELAKIFKDLGGPDKAKERDDVAKKYNGELMQLYIYLAPLLEPDEKIRETNSKLTGGISS